LLIPTAPTIKGLIRPTYIRVTTVAAICRRFSPVTGPIIDRIFRLAVSFFIGFFVFSVIASPVLFDSLLI
jgi:hypothetical protein